MFNEPLSDLMKVLASLVDSQNRILVPGFHDKVCALCGGNKRKPLCSAGMRCKPAIGQLCVGIAHAVVNKMQWNLLCPSLVNVEVPANTAALGMWVCHGG